MQKNALVRCSLSQDVGDDDYNLANKYPELKNWVIGCGAVGQFDSNHKYFFNMKSGNLSTTCGTIN